MPDDDRSSRDESTRDVGSIVRLTLAGVLVLLLAGFAIDNRRNVRVGWVFGDFTAPLIVVLLGAAVVGALIGWLALARVRRTGRREGNG